MKEESDELFEAFDGYMNNVDTHEHVLDEIGDLYAVLVHISGIIGVDLDDLLLKAIVKSEIRQVIPNYKRNEAKNT